MPGLRNSVKLLSRKHTQILATALLLGVASLCACGHSSGRQEEVLYVTAPQAILRDRVAPVYSKTGLVRNGERVVVLEHGRRWERVRDSRGEDGWLQDRYLTTQDTFTQFLQLRREHEKDPAQARGTLRSDFRLHVTPGRDTDRLFLIKEGEKVDLLQRRSVAKAASSAPPPLLTASSTAAEKQEASEAAKEDEKEYKGKERPPEPEPGSVKTRAVQEKLSPRERARKQKLLAAAPAVPMEDWWLVRDGQGHAGWVLGRMIDVDVPLDIAQYAEGQRIVAFFPLTSVHDSELNKDEPYYLVLLTEPKDGMPFDFNQIRVFSWNLRRHRYETAYRQRNLWGMLPAKVGEEDFGKLGNEPTFTIHVQGDDGKLGEEQYRLEGVIVKRVLAPGEVPVTNAVSKPAGRRHQG